MSIRTRFAPSPTGFLHVGGLRTALFAYLYAKHNDGTFVLRIEDTDRNRFVDGAVENLISSLKWAGITIDEGVDVDENHAVIQKGEKAPYIQSERLDIYKTHIDRLLESGDAYYAFDTPEELDEMRKRQQLNKQATIYERQAMKNQFTLGEQKTQELLDAGTPYVIRLKVPSEGETTFEDMVRGNVSFENKLIDDQVLMKADGYPTYHLANVVDDHEMQITHVIRGEEWLPSTPKHIMLYQAFGWDVPQFAHLSLLVNEKKAKLSKRHGDVAVEDFREKGYLPEALLNFVAFLGWNPGDERELFTLEQLIAEFSFDKVSKAAAVFNREKLDWFNKQYLMSKSLDEVTQLAIPFFVHHGILDTEEIDEAHEFERLKAAIDMERSRVATLAELPQALGFVFADELSYDVELLIWRKADAADAKAKLEEISAFIDTYDDEWREAALEENIIAWIKTQEYGIGNVLWPTRVALSGQKNSPGPFEIMAVLGKAEVLRRIGRAVERLES